MYKNQKITIFGIAKSGIASARKLASLGNRVTITESKPENAFAVEELNYLRQMGIELELGGHSQPAVDSADLIVVSPGVHLDIPVLKSAQAPIISEIELAYRLLTKPIIAVTGTNGKTTTATLLGEMLKAGGKKIAVAGNIGHPLVAVDDSNLDFIVAEISSYQLEACHDFRPSISVILNIQPDHLERHQSLAEYVKQKAKIFANQTGDDYLVYNLDDPTVVEMVKPAKAKLIGFAKSQAKIITLKPEEIRIRGRHNLENSLAAAQAAYICGVSRETVAQVLKTFPGVEHRIEFVAIKNGVEFRNDSKATNPDSTIVALKTFAGRGIILILGGRDKGTELSAMVNIIKQAVKQVVLIGEAAARFEQALRQAGYQTIQRAASLNDAVKQAFSLAAKGDMVLLSPACASFDMFQDYEERGRKFKAVVSSL